MTLELNQHTGNIPLVIKSAKEDGCFEHIHIMPVYECEYCGNVCETVKPEYRKCFDCRIRDGR